MNAYQGLVSRHVPAGAHALHLFYNLKAAGRWNRQGIYGCLYTSLSKEGALAEYRKYLERAGVPLGRTKPRELVSIEVTIASVYDVFDRQGTLVEASAGFLTGDSDTDLEQCRVLADTVRSLGYAAILVPSAALPGEKNLNIYFDGLVSHIDRLLEGPDRIPITPDGRI